MRDTEPSAIGLGPMSRLMGLAHTPDWRSLTLMAHRFLAAACITFKHAQAFRFWLVASQGASTYLTGRSGICVPSMMDVRRKPKPD